MNKNGIPAEHYYKLLEWKDENSGMFQLMYGNKSLNDLSTEELKALYKVIFKKKQKKWDFLEV